MCWRRFAACCVCVVSIYLSIYLSISGFEFLATFI
uniref:Uncharacterized protein n=1 Tax=Salix viminalis TaxID=40686 RepID=A0A6N2M8R2_SALVM